MADTVHVFDLARELGASISTIVRIADHLKLPLRRGAAIVRPGQAERIREEFRSGTWERRPSIPFERQPSRRLDLMRHAKCGCCELPFGFKHEDGAQPPRWCEMCASHWPFTGEDSPRTVERLEHHVRLFRDRSEFASTRASEYEARMKAAMETRQKWKAALVEVVLGHEEAESGGCACGDTRFPCASLGVLEQANRGIARQVERLTGLSRKELDRELYGREPLSDDWENPSAAS